MLQLPARPKTCIMYNKLYISIIDCYSHVPVLDIEICQYEKRTAVTGYYATSKFKKVPIDIVSTSDVITTLSTIGIFNVPFKGATNVYGGITKYAESLKLSYLIYSKSLVLNEDLKRVF